ncbi:MAG: hypothetical protein A4E26_00806 [Methanobacterium sp. PtaU1.Bin097]|nr:MAG: hypothetical protein A4E26_00806 [Methanobacterium sp. PtaU1.Bin097]
METDEKTFAVRDVSRSLIAFGILILLLNFNQYLIVYLFGAITLILGILNLFSLNLKIKFAGALNMALAGIYFVIFAFFLYPDRFGFIGNLIIMILGLVLLVLSVRFIYYYLKHKGRIRF